MHLSKYKLIGVAHKASFIFKQQDMKSKLTTPLTHVPFP